MDYLKFNLVNFITIGLMVFIMWTAAGLIKSTVANNMGASGANQ